VDFKTYVFMKWLLDVRYLEGSTGLHLDDLKATWFGVPHSQSDSEYPQLFIWNKLRSLVSEAADAPQRQYPSLVSFIGATGSGKSTLIRALIRMLEPVAREDYDAPLPGVNSDMFVSTSSDVHLYADPRTAKRTAPLYFAGMFTPKSHIVIGISYLIHVYNLKTARAFLETTTQWQEKRLHQPLKPCH